MCVMHINDLYWAAGGVVFIQLRRGFVAWLGKERRKKERRETERKREREKREMQRAKEREKERERARDSDRQMDRHTERETEKREMGRRPGGGVHCPVHAAWESCGDVVWVSMRSCMVTGARWCVTRDERACV